MPNTDLFTTIPQSIKHHRETFAQNIRNIARLSEDHGYKGIFIFSDNRLADPWTIAGFVLAETKVLLPIISLQPAYMHPYMAAKKISSLALLYKRTVALHLVAGGFSNDLIALNEHTEHDRRFDRLAEYTLITQELLRSDEPVSFKGDFYKIKNLRLRPSIPDALQPQYFLSGSSNAARKAAESLHAKLIENPEPYHTWKTRHNDSTPSVAIRIGIIARNNHDNAWKEARSRFPVTPDGTMMHHLNVKFSGFYTNKSYSGKSEQNERKESVYWLEPFEHNHTLCPYLVGNYEEVSVELSRYLSSGCDTCILDIPVTNQELIHTLQTFEIAEKLILP